MIHIRLCPKCNNSYDMVECPYCREKVLQNGCENQIEVNLGCDDGQNKD